MPNLRPDEGLAGTDTAGALSLRGLRTTDLGDGRHDLSRHPDPAAHVVPRYVVGDQPEDRGERQGAPAGLGVGQLRDGVDLAAQVAAGDGAAGARSADGYRRSRRDVPGRGRGGGAGPTDRKEGLDCGRRGGSGRGNGPHPDAADPRRHRRQPSSICQGGRRPGQSPAHRRLPQLRPAGEVRLPSPHHVSERPERIGGRAAAARAPSRVAPQTVAARHPSRCRHARQFGLLPRRVHVRL